MIPDLGQLGNVVYRNRSWVYDTWHATGLYKDIPFNRYMHGTKTVCNVCGVESEFESKDSSDLYDHIFGEVKKHTTHLRAYVESR